MMSEPRLTVGVISMDYPLLEGFLRHHAALLREPTVQGVIFAEPDMRDRLRGLSVELGIEPEVLTDANIRPVSPKRNAILQVARAGHVLYLDDDSWVLEPEKFMSRISGKLCHDRTWLLFTACYAFAEGATVMCPPQRMRTGCVGSGMEWNHVYPVKALRECGGWNELFGAGSPFGAEGFLMFCQLLAHGLVQEPVAEVVVRHPGFNPGESVRGDEKLRKVRQNQPALLVWLRRHEVISWWGFVLWTVRFALVPFGAGAVALMRGRYGMARVWLLSPWDFFSRLPRMWNDPRLMPEADSALAKERP